MTFRTLLRWRAPMRILNLMIGGDGSVVRIESTLDAQQNACTIRHIENVLYKVHVT